ncbi:MAG: UTP--glucose-1-phosphate uridylyltransferase, partial [Flavobacteriaceae bacterium]|nr:UTP--glucose-1-phosphate uridylyltransferase [Flavobacteriaceae bacterium]
MAAGSGSRYGALKQFDQLGPKNEFLFEFSVYDAIINGFDHIVIITKKDYAHEVEAYLKKRISKEIKIDIIEQEINSLPKEVDQKFKREKPWGTAHAIWVAKEFIDGYFVVINADDYYGKQAFKLASKFISKQQNKNIYALVPYLLKDTLSKHGTVSRGLCKRNENKLEKIIELTEIKEKDSVIIDKATNIILKANELVSMNFWICDQSIFNYIEKQFIDFLKDEKNITKGEIYIPFVIQNLIESGKITIELTEVSNSWFGVTYAEDKNFAVQLLKEMT